MASLRDSCCPLSRSASTNSSRSAAEQAGNPLAKSAPNLTKASELIRTDRSKAEAYARARGRIRDSGVGGAGNGYHRRDGSSSRVSEVSAADPIVEPIVFLS